MPSWFSDPKKATTENNLAIKEVGLSNFVSEVIEPSLRLPVLVDFWAPWCAPCKQLMPLLEQTVASFKGEILLTKVNVDQHPQLAQQLRVQSLPTVYAFYKQQPVDAFSGVITPTQLKAFCLQLIEMAKGTSLKLETGFAYLNEGNTQDAKKVFEEVLTDQPEEIQALIGLARCALEEQDIEQAHYFANMIPEEAREGSEVKALFKALSLIGKKLFSEDTLSLQQKVDQAETDHQARYDLALTLWGEGKKQEAIDHLLIIMKREKHWEDDKARQQLVEFFEALGFSHPLSIYGRKELSKIIFV